MLGNRIKKNSIIIMIVTLLFNIIPFNVAAETIIKKDDIKIEELNEETVIDMSEIVRFQETMTPEDRKALEYYLETGDFPETYAVAPWLVKLAKLVAGPVIETLLTFALNQALEQMSRSPQGSANERSTNSTKRVKVLYSAEFDPSLASVRVGNSQINNSYYVRLLQRALNSLGYSPGPIDGIWGTKTRSALISFQTDYKLTPDGVCGPATWRRLAHQ